MEKESEKQLPFLDVLSDNTNNLFKIIIYRKPTFTALL